jgi:hypothetical protein
MEEHRQHSRRSTFALGIAFLALAIALLDLILILLK